MAKESVLSEYASSPSLARMMHTENRFFFGKWMGEEVPTIKKQYSFDFTCIFVSHNYKGKRHAMIYTQSPHTVIFLFYLMQNDLQWGQE